MAEQETQAYGVSPLKGIFRIWWIAEQLKKASADKWYSSFLDEDRRELMRQEAARTPGPGGA